MLHGNTAKDSRRPWLVTILLAIFMVINFLDKAVLGIVGISMMEDLHIEPEQFGAIASSFFLFFSLSAIGFGLLADRMSTKVLLLICALIWTILQVPLALTASVPVLYFSRVLLGIGEGPAYPLSLHACYKWFPNDRRNIPSAVIFQGVIIGLLIAGPLLTYIMVNHSWHAAFGFLAAASAAWMVVWFILGKDGNLIATSSQVRQAGETVKKCPISYKKLLTDRTFFGNMILYWAAYWIFAVMFTWIPSYLGKILHYDATAVGWMFMLFMLVNIPISLGGSWISHILLFKGFSSKLARGGLTCLCTILGGLCLFAAIYLVETPFLKVIVLALGCNLPQIAFVLSSTIVAEISPKGTESALISINSAIATTGGLVAPALTGYFIQNSATTAIGYNTGFLVAGALLIVIGCVGFWLVNPAVTQKRFLILANQAHG